MTYAADNTRSKHIWLALRTFTLLLSSIMQFIYELLVGVASRLYMHWKWLLNGIVPHTCALDRTVLNFPISKGISVT